MIDVDHFKAVNDNHGHAVGDEVLVKVAAVLKSKVRKQDTVCRYGGEEFCVLLPHTDLDGAANAAEKLREAIEALCPANLTVTASLGVSTCQADADSPHEMIDRADKALYAAKNTGRNRVVRSDEVSELPQGEEETKPCTESPAEHDPTAHIPFPAVTALMTALEHRDVGTAVHSRNVADLCVAMANGLMKEADIFVLEVAGLLHDIGKLGIPDSILLKPGPLTDEEWKIMETHDRLGVEIINSSFGSAELTNIVKHCHASYGGDSRHPDAPKGEAIPLRSRIVLLADAYDAMTTDRVYRKALSQEDAFAELRRCAGTQFDPSLAEHLIETVLARDENRRAKSVSDSQAKALRIGLEIERLACAAEAHDMAMLTAIAEHLIATAAKLGLSEIAAAAGELKDMAGGELGQAQLMECTTKLLELCPNGCTS